MVLQYLYYCNIYKYISREFVYILPVSRQWYQSRHYVCNMCIDTIMSYQCTYLHHDGAKLLELLVIY